MLPNKRTVTTEQLRNIIGVSTLIFYILFSIIKRFGSEQNLFLIPLLLFLANCTILVEIIIQHRKNRVNSERKSFRWVYFQLATNVVAALLSGSYLI